MLKKIKIALLSAALLGGTVAVVSASPSNGSKPAITAEQKAEWKAKREERETALFEKIDTNKDGKITQAELEAFAVKMADKEFAKMDTSKTGSVDISQFKAAKQARGGMHKHHRHGLKGQGGESTTK
jgi:hypothetical protein